MNKEHLQRSIVEADNNSLRIGAANRIVQLLDKLRHSNNENSAKRWIWELCQNAKDVSNNTGRVKISINFNKENKIVVFKHNGKAFSMMNVMSLINQSSSKDRTDEVDRESGKFGTGFITTHLLSEIVNVSGVLESETGKYSRFDITLDRTGHEKNEIIKALERSVEQLQECQPLLEEDLDPNAYNTMFEYELDEYGVEVARQGIENLRVSAPYVLSMLRDIEEITLESTGEVYRYIDKNSCGLENAFIHEILYESAIEKKSIFVLNVEQDDTTISIALDCCDNTMNIMPFADEQSKLFCDFPLIGTEDFPFPVLVCSRAFNPTEPRDGIVMFNSKMKIDNKIEQNRNILEKACELYKKLLAHVAEEKWSGIYNITCINPSSKKEWYDKEFADEIVDCCKDTILHTPIIRTSSDSMMELLNCFDSEQVFIISERDDKIRENVWDLMNRIMPERIPCKEDIHNWYHSLWSDCNSYTFKTLTKQLQDYRDVEQLQNNIAEKKWKTWLSDYYDLISDNKNFQTYISSNKIKVIPNQNGVFCGIEELKLDNEILAEYKDILNILDNDCREWLLDLNVKNREWFQFKEFDNEQTLKLIEGKLDDAARQQKTDIFLKLAYLYRNGHELLGVQIKICQYANKILETDNQLIEVPVISEKLLQEALKYIMTSVADKISELGDVVDFSQYMNLPEANAIEILKEFVEFAVQHGYDNLINKSTKPILPNQNGKFMIKDDIFLDNEMDETLKELAVSAGQDIKAVLLIRNIYLDLPESRWKNDSDVSQAIVQYVNKYRNTKETEVRNNFRKLLLWLSDHEEKAKDIFPELYRNKHYLYDDEEISLNIKQAETLHNIMDKFGISSPEKLEEIIRKSQVHKNEDTDVRIEITEDILLQYGIDSEDALETAFTNADFANQFIRPSKHKVESFEYVKSIIDKSKDTIISYLKTKKDDGYDLTDIQPLVNSKFAINTIFVIKKDGKEIYLLTRPSNGGEVRIFYSTEKDILDYSMDWELWVSNGKDDPQKLTFGKIIKLTKLNRIPLKGMMGE
ncbi:ATP-binding protein [Paenibacillus oenotherae]|uniref:ATP-binding protein n=1 Tax=Paenibacillus oenotherae TaxID=1435645 RepID=A0ABS7D219_9BACL|nr:ATP-binding protein [Paenibacillus oenotherae]MBW7473984.1 ATP-binding protein [Paenibacillus oenotherae]